MRKKLLKTMKRTLCYVLTLGMIAGSVLPAQAEETLDLTSGLLAHYDFETVTDTTVTNKANADTFAGALSGSATVGSETEALGQSLKLGSAAGGMQLTDIVNASTTSFSVSMWYKATATSGSNVNLVQAGTMDGSSGRTILILNPDSKYQTYLTADNAKTPTQNAINRMEWQHVTFAYDQANSKAYFYVNGVADRADGLSLSGTAVSIADMIIGRHRNANEGQFNGWIDEVRVYNKVVSADEAKAIYDEKANLVYPPETPGEAEDIVITLDPAMVERELDDSVFGINHRYAFNGYGSFDSYLMEVKDDFKELYEEAGFGSIRYPGGTISNLFNWKTTLDSVGRKKQIHGFYNNSGQGGIAPNFGIKEIADFADEVNSEIVYVYSLGRGSAQDAEDLIEFLNAEVGTNPNGGIDWAAVRAENGHPEPYNVRYFEIGNEMQQVYADGTTSQGYWLHGVSDSTAGYISGGTATFTQQYAVCEEDWNSVASQSDGSANLVRYMRYANTNPKMYDENGNIVDNPSFQAVVEGSVSVYVGSTQWTIVDSFENSGAADNHVVVDYSTGALKFGDGEKGAIPAAGQQIKVTYSVERDGFVQISEAMKETTEAINAANTANGVEAQHEAYVYSSYETSGFISGMESGGYNDLYDGLTIHPYSGTPSGTGEAFYDSAMSLAESSGIAKVQNYVNMMPDDKVPVISEYGIYNSRDALVRSQTHAVYIAKVLMEYVRLGSPYIQKHCLVDWYSSGGDSLGPTQQAVIQAVPQSGASTATGEGEFDFFATPSAHVFQMFNTAFGDEVIASNVSTTETLSNGVAAYSVLASKDSYDNYYAAIVNVDRENAKNMELVVDGVDLTGKDVEIQLLTSDSYADENTLENPDNVVIETTALVNEGSSVALEIPKHSVMVVKVSAGVDKTALEEAIEDAKDLVKDDYTADSWSAAGLEAAITAGQTVLDNADATDADVEAALAGIQEAVEALVYVTADKEALNAKIAEADALTVDEYAGNSWAAMQQVLSAAKTVAAKENAAQELVDKVLEDLTAAMDALKKIIPVSVMTATAGNSHNDTLGPENVLDNDTDSKWHTDWYGTSRENHYIQFALSEEYVVDGLCYLPRQDDSNNGTITGYEIQVSDDGETWKTVAEGTWASNKEWKFVEFEGQNATYVRFISKNAVSDNSYVFASAASVRLTGEKPAEEPVVPTTPVTDIFEDVSENDWFADEVQYVYDKGIMTGTSETTFEPNLGVTRATIVQTLYKLEGKPAVDDFTKYNSLNDTLDEIWWKNALAWALNTGVAKGDSNNHVFNPDNEVTREDLATFIYRYATEMGICGEFEGNVDEILGDTFVNSWAETAFAWAIDTGLIKGKTMNGASDLAPQVGATRAELATIMMRFYQNNNL